MPAPPAAVFPAHESGLRYLNAQNANTEFRYSTLAWRALLDPVPPRSRAMPTLRCQEWQLSAIANRARRCDNWSQAVLEVPGRIPRARHAQAPPPREAQRTITRHMAGDAVPTESDGSGRAVPPDNAVCGRRR